MKRFRVLPLGVDHGSSRLRIAVCETNGTSTRVKAVAARDLPQAIDDDAIVGGALFEEMLGELGVRERRCVTAVGAEDATLRTMTFPTMTWGERLRAARYEASRFAPSWQTEGARVRVHPVDASAGTYAIGVVRETAVARRAALVRSARLRLIAVDFDGFALRRVIDAVDAVLDVGSDRSTLHVYAGSTASYHVAAGGACVTRTIASDLSIDEGSAERRKRILGVAGAGTAGRDELVRALAATIETARTRTPIARVALVGNGARLPGLSAELERATGATIDAPVAEILHGAGYPDDVLRTAAPDWTLAAALTTWSVA